METEVGLLIDHRDTVIVTIENEVEGNIMNGSPL